MNTVFNCVVDCINFILSFIATVLFLLWVLVIRMSCRVFAYSLVGAFLGILRAYEEAEEEINKGF